MSKPQEPLLPAPNTNLSMKDFEGETTQMFLDGMDQTEKVIWGRLHFLNKSITRMSNERLRQALYYLALFAPIFFILGMSIAFQLYVVLPLVGTL